MLYNRQQCKLRYENVLNSSTNIGLVYNDRLLDYIDIVLLSYFFLSVCMDWILGHKAFQSVDFCLYYRSELISFSVV